MIDRVELRELVERYARAVDDRDGDALGALFAPDGLVDSTRGTTFGVADFVASTMDAQARWAVTQHLVTGQVVDLDGDDMGAAGDVYTLAVHRSADGDDELVVGLRYLDRYVKTGRGWRFARRTLRPQWWKGEWPWATSGTEPGGTT